MEKIICALWKDDATDRDSFNSGLLEKLPDKLAAAGASSIRINVEDSLTDKGAHLRQSRADAPPNATVQYWLPSANAMFRKDADAAVSGHADSWAAWLVAESTVIPNAKHPTTSGGRCEGWSQLAFLTRPERLTYEEWIDIWHSHHTKVAIETQSNFEYVQNVVVRALTDDAPPYAAIVEECFPEAALSDPQVFFDAEGDQTKFDTNLARMMDSCARFMDRGTIDVIPSSQYNF